MLRALILLLLIPVLAAKPPTAPRPSSVLVLYNSNLSSSKELAELYASGRNIPKDQVVGLPLPDQEQINRQQYETLIRQPLIQHFDEKRWWDRARTREGKVQIRSSKIKIVCCIRGVPSRIHQPPPPPAAPADGQPAKPRTANELLAADKSASVDSELTMLGNEGELLQGPLRNPYFDKDEPFATSRLPLLLVGRIDAHSSPICEIMIRDALAIEQTGLWGFAAIDIANKFPLGDNWLKNVASSLHNEGFPTLVEKSDHTLPLNFPLPPTALYFGWYGENIDGPFVNPSFRFKRGAIAVHLHSYSASQLRNPAKNWTAGLLGKGACASLGNTFEPYLQFTHHFDIFQQRLFQGYTLIEAAYMAYPSLSWQGVVLGDPLYRPFLHLQGTGEKIDADQAFRALRVAQLRWKTDPLERERQLRAAAKRMNDATFLEAIALDLLSRDRSALAASTLEEAKLIYPEDRDKLRMDLLIAMIDRDHDRTEAAVQRLNQANLRYASIPETKAAVAWQNQLNPPPPTTPPEP